MNVNSVRIFREFPIQLIGYSKRFSSETLKPKPSAASTQFGLAEKPNADDVKHDYIGPADKESNLRPVVRHIPENETNLEQHIRLKRIEVENWNQDFWKRHNKRFYEDKEKFVQQYKASGVDEISADRMSIFYKDFLDRNRKLHFYYNVAWYAKNFDLLVLSGQLNVQKLFYKIRK